MLFGRHFRLQTDHRPLLRIFGSHKGIPVYTANRLQRFALQLLMYDFTIEYVQTDKFGNADVLSRLIHEHAKPDPEYVIASAEDVAKATESDPVLKKVYGYIMEGWPQNVAYAAELACFYHRSEALTTVRGCILFGERVVIPSKLQQRCLKQLHKGHPGIQRMKSKARSYVYWPSVDKDIMEHSPAEAMLGRKMRTALELLKPPPAAQAEPANLDRRFQRGDLVYAKFYARNSWKWVPAQIIRELGSVMFEVQTNNQRVHRPHVNQLRKRDSAVGASSEDVDIDHLPFDLLTDST
ncbi:uncharacterized protein LOC121603058, partial [Anopheles merus]|uniref:uncharacterized protein LOC121603058 n=1 Tax=Anopheles merus TaxID=30066 RepID=UPI001BE45BC0